MAYKDSALVLIEGSRPGFRLYGYDGGADTLADIAAENYFLDVIGELAVNDALLIHGSDAHGLVVVNSKTNSLIDVTDALNLSTGGAIAVPAIASWHEAYEYNLANLNTLYGSGTKYTLSAALNAFGDSLTQGNIAGSPGNTEDPWPEKLAAWIDATINNLGVGGETTTQIKDRVVAASAGVKASFVTLQGSGNDFSQQASVAAASIANFDLMDAELTGDFLVIGGSGSLITPVSGGGVDRQLIWERHVSEHGARAIDMREMFAQAKEVDEWDAADITAILRSNTPPSLLIDAVHPTDEGIDYLAQGIAARVIAVDGGGIADPISETIAIDDSAAEDALLHTMKVAGTPTGWAFAGGNDNDEFTINSSGEIRRGTGALDADFNTVFVQAQGATAAHSRVAPVVMARKDNSLLGGVRIGANMAYGLPPQSGTTWEVDEFTMIFRVRNNIGATDCALYSGTGKAPSSANNAEIRNGAFPLFRITDRATAGFIVSSSQSGTSVAAWRWIGMSFQKGATSLIQAMRNDTVSTIAAAAGKDDLQAWLGDVMMFFSGGTTLGNSFPVDASMLWFAPSYLDLSDSAVRDQFRDSVTKAPVALANGREIGGVTPLVYFAGGRPGNWLPSSNRGTAANLVSGIPRAITPEAMLFSVAE